MTLVHYTSDVARSVYAIMAWRSDGDNFHSFYFSKVCMDHYLSGVYTSSKVKGHWHCMNKYFVFTRPKLWMCKQPSFTVSQLLLFFSVCVCNNCSDYSILYFQFGKAVCHVRNIRTLRKDFHISQTDYSLQHQDWILKWEIISYNVLHFLTCLRPSKKVIYSLFNKVSLRDWDIVRIAEQNTCWPFL